MRILLDQGLPRSAAGILRDEGWDAARSPSVILIRQQRLRSAEVAALLSGAIGQHRVAS